MILSCNLSDSKTVQTSETESNPRAISTPIYSNGFETMNTGLADDRAIKSNWATRYAKGPDEGRVYISDSDTNSGSRAAKITYPKEGNQSSPSGATWETNIDINSEELYMSYWVKFDSDFEWRHGGKLPGLAGMDVPFPYSDNNFTARLMWREDGKIEFYLHGFNINNSQGAEPYRLYWDDFGGHAQFQKGKWHHIEIHVKLNTPGKRDGLLEGWLDGELRCRDKDNSGVRAAGQTNTKLNYMYFSTFFGGSSDQKNPDGTVTPAGEYWGPTKDVYAYFDDFILSTERIGINGEIPEDDTTPDEEEDNPEEEDTHDSGEGKTASTPIKITGSETTYTCFGTAPNYYIWVARDDNQDFDLLQLRDSAAGKFTGKVFKGDGTTLVIQKTSLTTYLGADEINDDIAKVVVSTPTINLNYK